MSSRPVLEVHLERFRCFADASFEPGPGLNVVAGGNASGKTSLLEAFHFLGRGSSFRAARAEAAIQFGAEDLLVFGRLDQGEVCRVGVAVSRDAGLSVRLDGAAGTRADLARALPVQILDPTCHELISGPPAVRRQFLDWCVFHVEHEFLDAWQRYRRALQQRNAALRVRDTASAWAWDDTLGAAGVVMDRCRRAALERMAPHLQSIAAGLLDSAVEVGYSQGWPEGTSLEAAVLQSRERDSQQATSTTGPHRGDLRITIRDRRARETVSRGQEKLVAAAMIMAEVQVVAEALGRPVVLLVDEPGADLDRRNLQRLLAAVAQTNTQAFVTTLDPEQLQPPPSARLFHVEHGVVRPLL